MAVREGQHYLSVVVEGISTVGTENFAILGPHLFFLPPPRAGVGIHQHEPLFVSRYLLHSSVQARSECMFITSILCLSRSTRHKKPSGLGSTL